MTKANRTKIHVFLGAGGVGKTTLSAAFALALARKGYSVGLISVDPARRLRGALGVAEISEAGTDIHIGGQGQGQGSLRAAFLNVSACFTRWVEQEGMNPQSRERLFSNRLFRALVDRFATATDTFAAVRVAEWSEAESFDHIVVDTAPGLHALDFLTKPDKLMAFLDSKLVDWLKWFVGSDPEKRSVFHRVFKSGAKRVMDGLAQIGGQNFLVNFGEFLVLLDDVFATMLRRLQVVVAWLRSDKSHFYLVTAVREDAVFVARRLVVELDKLGTKNRVTIVNKAFPQVLGEDFGFLEVSSEHHLQRVRDEETGSPAQGARDVIGGLPLSGGGLHPSGALADPTRPETPFLNFLASYTRLQSEVVAEMKSSSGGLIMIPLASGLDGSGEIRLEDLVSLGDHVLGRVSV